MPKKIDMATAKSNLLAKLRQAGEKGLAKSLLQIKKGTIYEQAFNELLKERQIANLGTSKRPQIVLAEHFRPLEMACERIVAKFPDRDVVLLSKAQLEEGLKGAVLKQVGAAIDWLVKEGKLLRAKRGALSLLMSTVAVKHHLPETRILEPIQLPLPATVPAQPPQPSTDVESRIMAAYQVVKQRERFSDVEIYSLQQESGVTMPELKAFLLHMSRAGRAVLSLGDWSLSSEEIRSGAVEIHGRQNLMVRFK